VPVISKQLHEIAALVMVPSKSVQADAEHITEDIMRPWMQRRHVPSDVQAPLLESVSGVHRHIGEYLNQIGTALPVVAGNIVLAIFIIVAAYYLLSDYHKIVGKMLLFVKPESQLNALRITNEVVAVFGNYVRGVVVVMLMDIVVIYITLRALGIDHAETIAFVSGVLYAVPYIGAAISTVLIGVVAFADHHNGLAFALLTTAIMIVIHQIIFNMIVAPRVIGKHVGLHPLWAITAMMVGYTVMGVGGTVLAVPIAGAIQVVLVHFLPKLKDEEVARMSEEYSQRLNSRSIKQIVSENVDSAPAGAPPPLAEAKVPPAPASVGGLPPTT